MPHDMMVWQSVISSALFELVQSSCIVPLEAALDGWSEVAIREGDCLHFCSAALALGVEPGAVFAPCSVQCVRCPPNSYAVAPCSWCNSPWLEMVACHCAATELFHEAQFVYCAVAMVRKQLSKVGLRTGNLYRLVMHKHRVMCVLWLYGGYSLGLLPASGGMVFQWGSVGRSPGLQLFTCVV
ncbi:hypothetical protein COO60DRAFT_528919 [Scenedesmus sp. NREL 46B-D3]|nr:hypothetical protein COO60DRAFT_528919 [Scenedesmus sp. NREL 46B-D3]